jgi:hypothetical protein
MASGRESSLRCVKCGRAHISVRRPGICALCRIGIKRRAEFKGSRSNKSAAATSASGGSRSGPTMSRQVKSGGPSASPIVRARIAPRMSLESAYSESCLPRTMELAMQTKRLISAELRGINRKWAFEDRVLVWVAEYWSKDVEEYYRAGTRTMAEQFSPHQIEHFDEAYRQVLGERLKEIESSSSVQRPSKRRRSVRYWL